jgi:ectoine hydroxylase-related dioxygenase (phytanoyl-CoA dioxygenase family)
MSFLSFFKRRLRASRVFQSGGVSLSVRLENDLKTTSGIAMFRIAPSGKMNGPHSLVVSANTQGTPATRFERIPDTVFQLGVHTHHFPTGVHQILFSLRSAEREIFRAEISLSISHQTPLAGVIADVFKRESTPLAFLGCCDASNYPYHATDALPWFDRPDAEAHIEALLDRKEITEREAGCLRQFVRDGYLVVEDLIDDALIKQVNREIDDAIAKCHQGYKQGSSARMEHLHKEYPNIRKLWLDRRHLRFADLIFNTPARPCQTLVFVCGSQQDVHSDVIHLTPFPAGYMCGIWIALQDVVADSGELVVYPGSHRTRRIYLGDTGTAKVTTGDWSEFGRKVVPLHAQAVEGREPFVYRPKRGTVLIWHENLLHGGSVRRNPALERRSMVIHTFADGAVAYYDSSGTVGTVVSREILNESAGGVRT